MTVTRGSLLPVEAVVPESYDVGQKQGYMVKKELTVDGTPGEAVIRDGIWEAIKAAGDLPVYVKVTLTWAGHEWPWSKDVSKFDVEYQAVHMAEGSILVTIAAVILYALPYVASILLVLLGWVIVRYSIMKTEAVAKWIEEHGPEVAAGMGAGVVILAGLILLGGDDKK